MDYKLILDLIVAILLCATIGYALVLNRKLMQLRRNRDDLARLITAFNEATMRAEAGIPKLKRAAEEAGSILQERVEKAQSLRDDLAFMIERADTMANRLEGTVRSARVETKMASSPAARRPAPSAAAERAAGVDSTERPGNDGSAFAADDSRSEAERELLRALQSVR